MPAYKQGARVSGFQLLENSPSVHSGRCAGSCPVQLHDPSEHEASCAALHQRSPLREHHPNIIHEHREVVNSGVRYAAGASVLIPLAFVVSPADTALDCCFFDRCTQYHQLRVTAT